MLSIEEAASRACDVYVDGAWQTSATTATIPLVNPATEQVFAQVADVTIADVDRCVASARAAFDTGPWPHMAVAERVAILRQVAAMLGAGSDAVADVITTEMGSPVTFSRAAQAPVARMVLEYYCDLAAEFPWEQARQGRSAPAVVLQDPVGVVAAIAPFNYPLSLLMMKVAPALVAGCTVVAKPSPETSLDAKIVAQMFHDAGLPPGVLNIVAAGRAASEHLVQHRYVDKVAFTGSTPAGRRIAELCGRDLRRCSLELGGKSAAVILDDIPVDAAVAGIRSYALRNSGQTCSNQTRVLVPRRRHDELAAAIGEMVGSLTVGDPTDERTFIGPMATSDQRARVESYFAIARDEGARAIVGGRRPPDLGLGFFVEPTVYVDVHNDMRIAREEIFGPVLAIIPYDGEDDAVRIANDSEFGLAASVWADDYQRAESVARRIRAGMLLVNGAGGSLDAPYGGFKASGIGREMGPEGLFAYLESKSIPMAPDAGGMAGIARSGGT